MPAEQRVLDSCPRKGPFSEGGSGAEVSEDQWGVARSSALCVFERRSLDRLPCDVDRSIAIAVCPVIFFQPGRRPLQPGNALSGAAN